MTEIAKLYLLFGVLLYLPENKGMKRVLRFCLSMLLFSLFLKKLFP